MNIRQLRLVLVLTGLAFASACRNQVTVAPVPSPVAQPGQPAAAPAEPIAAGPVMDEQISYQFAIYYLPQPKDEFVRAITLGMEKFGLPDLIAEDFPWSLNRNMGTVINLLSQSLAEGAEVPRSGEFDLDFRAIKHAGFRETQLESLKANATGIALLTLHKGVWEEGDPANRLVKIGFGRGTGPDDHAKQEQVIASAFGAEDAVTRIKHDDALRATSAAARTKLPGMRADFLKGLEPGEFIQVKTPFDTPDGGQEWMWVEITKWEGDKITGLLQNDPFDIPTLHAGQVVVVSEAKVFDYIRKRPDGSREGNETGKLIQSQSK